MPVTTKPSYDSVMALLMVVLLMVGQSITVVQTKHHLNSSWMDCHDTYGPADFGEPLTFPIVPLLDICMESFIYSISLI